MRWFAIRQQKTLTIKTNSRPGIVRRNIMKNSNKRETKNYALIYFRDKKPLKKPYDTASKAFYDYEDRGCVLVELFNERGTLLTLKKPSIK